MGGGCAKEKCAKEFTVSILGVQGAGKSTVMKQLCDDGGNFRLSPEREAAVKQDILKAVAMRTRVLMEHCSLSSSSLAAKFDEFRDIERDFLSWDDEVRRDRSTLKENARGRSFSSRPGTDLQEVQGQDRNDMLLVLGKIWESNELLHLDADEQATSDLLDGLRSTEKEQLFLAGGTFVGRVKQIMDEEYHLTRSDYLNSRSWTKCVKEATLKLDGCTMTLRDFGGDEMNRARYWRKAVGESTCSLFVVSLSDYAKHGTNSQDDRLQDTREALWSCLLHAASPRIILVLNKHDLFSKKLERTPLHTCNHFTHVSPRVEAESHQNYVKRCEAAMLDFFSQTPASVDESSKPNGIPHPAIKITAAFVTQANDGRVFSKIKDQIFEAVHRRGGQ